MSTILSQNAKRKAPSGDAGDAVSEAGHQSKRPRGATLHDPIQAAQVELLQAAAEAAAACEEEQRAKVAAARAAQPAKQRFADARAALAHAYAQVDDPADLPCFPVAVRGGRRFPWSIALQFAAARDLATLAVTHRAARDVTRHEQTARRVLKARHGRGCKRPKTDKCKCPGCARVALLLRAAETLGVEVVQRRLMQGDRVKLKPGETNDYQAVLRSGEVGTIIAADAGDEDVMYEVSGPRGNRVHGDDSYWFREAQLIFVNPRPLPECAGHGGPSRWLRVLHYTEGAAAGRLPVRRYGGTWEKGEGNQQFNEPMGLHVEPGVDGHVYVADDCNHRVQVLTKDGVHVRTLGVTGQQGQGNHQLSGPRGVFVSDGLVYVSGYDNHRVQVLTKDGAHVRTLGVTGQAGEGNHQFRNPEGVFVEPGPDGRVYVADMGNHRVQVLTKEGAHVRTIGVTGQRGEGNDRFNYPRSVFVDHGTDGYVYVPDMMNHLVQVFTKDGAHVRTIGVSGQSGKGNDKLHSPWGVCVGHGRIYVAEMTNHRVQVFTKEGAHVRTIGVSGESGRAPGKLNQPSSVALADGLLYVSDMGNHRVQVFVAGVKPAITALGK